MIDSQGAPRHYRLLGASLGAGAAEEDRRYSNSEQIPIDIPG
jgi:hypothetical protein